MTKLWTGHESVTDGQADGQTDGRSLFLYPPFFFEKAGDNKKKKLVINMGKKNPEIMIKQ
jgi:hypothetical protein